LRLSRLVRPLGAQRSLFRARALQESGVAGYEQLFADSARRRAKLEELAQRPPEEATFRPKVGHVLGQPCVSACVHVEPPLLCERVILLLCGSPWSVSLSMRDRCAPLPCPLPQVNTSSVVLRKLLVGQHGDRAPSSASDVAERWAPPQPLSARLPP
jgi:hypothetical protein